MTGVEQEKEPLEFKFHGAFSTYSVDSLDNVRKFYGETLGIAIADQEMGLGFKFPGQGLSVFLYPKDDHEPATFTVLNLQVTDIKEAVAALRERGVEFESYGGDIETDADDIYWGAQKNEGPNLAWFKDPAGNILSLVEHSAE